MSNTSRTLTLPVSPSQTLTFPYGKDPAEILDYVLDATDFVADHGGTLSGVDVFRDPTISVTEKVVAQSKITVTVAGGTPGTMPQLSYLLHISGGNVVVVNAKLQISLRMPVGLVPILPLTGSIGAGEPLTTLRTAGADISADRVLMYNLQGQVVHADPLNTAYGFSGISTQAAVSGATLTVCEEGPLSEVSWSWTPGAVIFVGPGGTLTMARPTSGVLQQVAIASSATSIVVRAYDPIILI